MGQPPPCWSQHSLSFLPYEWHMGPSEMGARPVLSLRHNASFKHPREKTALETLRAPGSTPPRPILVKHTPSGVMSLPKKTDPRSIRTHTYLWIYQCPPQTMPLGTSVVSESSIYQDVGSLLVLPERSAIAESSTVQSSLSSEGDVWVLLFAKQNKKMPVHLKRGSPPYP